MVRHPFLNLDAYTEKDFGLIDWNHCADTLRTLFQTSQVDSRRNR